MKYTVKQTKTETLRDLTCNLEMKDIVGASLSMVFETSWSPEDHNKSKGTNQKSVTTDLVEIPREIGEQFIKKSMCNYLEGHKVLDGNQYAFVRLCQGCLISFQVDEEMTLAM